MASHPFVGVSTRKGEVDVRDPQRLESQSIGGNCCVDFRERASIAQAFVLVGYSYDACSQVESFVRCVVSDECVLNPLLPTCCVADAGKGRPLWSTEMAGSFPSSMSSTIL